MMNEAQQRRYDWSYHGYGKTSLAIIDHLDTFGSMTATQVVLQLGARYEAVTIRRTLYRLQVRGDVNTRREGEVGSILWAVA